MSTTGIARPVVNERTAQIPLGELHRRIVDKFTIDDLKTVCLRLEVNWDEIAGETLSAKSRELLLYLDRRGRLNELNGAIATRDNSKPVRHISTVDELRGYLGFWDGLIVRRVLRTIRRGRMS